MFLLGLALALTRSLTTSRVKPTLKTAYKPAFTYFSPFAIATAATYFLS